MSHPLQPLIEDFLADQINSGKAKTTVGAYRHTLNKLTRHYNGPVTELNAGALRRFLATANGDPNSRARLYSQLKNFLNWCYRFDYITSNPITKLEPPRWHEYPPRPIPSAHLQKLQKEIAAAPEPYRFLFTLLMETGMRSGRPWASR